MAEICIEQLVEWEGCWVAVECSVGAGVIYDWLPSHTSYELVHEANALSWAERVSVGISVVLVQGLVVVV